MNKNNSSVVNSSAQKFNELKTQDINEFELKWIEIVKNMTTEDDPSHDFAHFQRVVATTKKIAAQERGSRLEILIPAAWFHDLVQVPKNDPRRSEASRLSALKAIEILSEMNYPERFYPEIQHAIEAHSFSANIECRSLEAAIIQDADRLDGLGAIGIARMFTIGGKLSRRFYDPEDPWCEQGREWNDQINTVDHFYVKLFKTVNTLKTEAGKLEGERRAKVMKDYIEDFKIEMRL